MAEVIAVVPTQEEAQFKCRICLTDNVNLYSFDDLLVIPLDKPVPVAEALCEVTSESLENIRNPLLPHQACENCVTQLRDSYIFKLSFSTSALVWAAYLSQMETIEQPVVLTKVIKTEPNLKIEFDDENDNDNDIEFAKGYLDNLKSEENINLNTSVLHNTVKIHNNKKQRRKKIVSISPRLKVKKLFPCPLCTDQFAALDLKSHIKTHDALKSYLTAKGIPKYKNKVKFYAVQKPGVKPLISRTDPIQHKCIYCKVRLPVQEFNAHIDQHIKEGNVTCDICNRRFHDIKALRTHRVNHIKQHQFTCEHCGKGFLDEENYKCHLLAHNDVFMHKCEYCSKEFANPGHLKRHIDNVHKIGSVNKFKRYQFQCKACLCRYQTRSEIDTHLCIPVTRENSMRKTHILPSHMLRTRMMSRFPGQVNESRYPASKKILCHHCGKYVYNATAHMARHSDTGTMDNTAQKSNNRCKKVLCQDCGKSVWNTSLKEHIHRHHTGVKSEICETCGKLFWRKSQLQAHMRVHTGEKPFKCGFCALAFSRYNNMRVHERIHIGIKAHVCETCGKGFYEKSYLKKHMKTHRDKYPELTKLMADGTSEDSDYDQELVRLE